MKHFIFAFFIIFTGCTDLAPIDTDPTGDKDQQIAELKQQIAELEAELEEEVWYYEQETARLFDLNLALKKKIQILERQL